MKRGICWAAIDAGRVGPSLNARDEENSASAPHSLLLTYCLLRTARCFTALSVQYYYTSRLPGEPDSGVNDVHFHPVEPRQLRVALLWGSKHFVSGYSGDDMLQRD